MVVVKKIHHYCNINLRPTISSLVPKKGIFNVMPYCDILKLYCLSKFVAAVWRRPFPAPVRGARSIKNWLLPLSRRPCSGLACAHWPQPRPSACQAHLGREPGSYRAKDRLPTSLMLLWPNESKVPPARLWNLLERLPGITLITAATYQPVVLRRAAAASTYFWRYGVRDVIDFRNTSDGKTTQLLSRCAVIFSGFHQLHLSTR